MWRTSEGDRVLVGAVWELVREALGSLVGWTDQDEPYDHGVEGFDDLTRAQRLATLAQVGRALADPAVPTPRHTARLEAAIAAIFEAI